MSYKEHKKLVRVSAPLKTETVISSQLNGSAFSSTSSREYSKRFDRFEVSRGYGAGVKVELYDSGNKRATSLSTELGKSEVLLLIEYLNGILPELKDYAGTYIDEPLVDLTK